MTQYAFYFDSSRCTGCKTCEIACKDYKDLSQTVAFRRIFDYEGGIWTANDDGTYDSDTFAYHLSMACNHCTLPLCMNACPVGAISKDENNGIVRIDENSCVADKSCIEACPYDVPQFDEEKNVSRKCDFCYERVVDQGLNPICVDSCPLRALDFGEVEELREKYGDLAAIAPMPSDELTGPNIVIKTCPAAKEPGDTIGAVLNEKEVSGVPAQFEV